MIQSEVTIIALSKAKLLLALVIGFAFVAGGYWLFNLDNSVIESGRRYNNPLFVHGVGIACVVMGVLGIIAIMKKLFDKAPGLMLDTKGITVNSAALTAGFIPWRDISGTQIRQIKNQRILYLLLKDPDKYIDGCNPFKRALLRASQKMAVSPVGINTNSLQIGFDDLVALVDKKLAQYGVDA